MKSLRILKQCCLEGILKLDTLSPEQKISSLRMDFPAEREDPQWYNPKWSYQVIMTRAGSLLSSLKILKEAFC